jgi:CBS domain containing-hemolysin-like protein
VDYIPLIILIVFLIICSACFSAAETAFTSVSKIRLKQRAENGDKRAARAYKTAEHYEKTLTAILVGNNIVNILAASLGTILFTELFGAAGVGISTAVMTLVVLIFGEITPKSFAKLNPEPVALFFAGLLNLLTVVFTPFVMFFGLIQKLLVKAAFRDGVPLPSVTEDELKLIVSEIEDEGVLEEQESKLVRSALEFDDITVEKVLLPRTKVAAAEKNTSVDELKHLFINERYSRLPVFDETIDNIIGIINEKDFFAYLMSPQMQSGAAFDISALIQKALYVTEMNHISEVLNKMQKTKIHMAIVKDQYGGTSGIVTLEDIIEELVGEIYDENDEIIPPVVHVEGLMNTYDIEADYNLEDCLERLVLPKDTVESEANTIGGYVMEKTGGIPKIGDIIEDGIFTITILDADEQTVKKLRLTVNDEK